MFSCAVFGCANDSITGSPSVNFYAFPKNNIFTEQWVQACGWQSDLIDTDTARICSIHFDESAFSDEIKMVDFTECCSKTLKYDAVPTFYLPRTKIIIKDQNWDPSNIEGVVLYAINSTTTNDEITTICLPDAELTKQFFKTEPSTSDIEIETHPVKDEITEKCSYIKSSPDLHILQANNISLKRKNEALEKEIRNLEQILNFNENNHAKLTEQCTILEAQITDKHVLQQVQKFRNKERSLFEQKLLLSKVFSESQIKILLGKKKLYWTNDDIAMGYTIRHLSNRKCYAYLKNTLNIPLPGKSSIERWAATNRVKKLQNTKKDEDNLTL